MPAQLTPEDAAFDKVFYYGLFSAYRTVVALPDSTPDDTTEANQAKADYLRPSIPGNANPYVPWADTSKAFPCPTCDEVITADQEHPLHPEDAALLKQYPPRPDDV